MRASIDEDLEPTLLLPPSEVCKERYLDVVGSAAIGVVAAVVDEFVPSSLGEVDFELCSTDSA